MWLLLVNGNPNILLESEDLAKAYAQALYEDVYATFAMAYTPVLPWYYGRAEVALHEIPNVKFKIEEVDVHSATFVLSAEYGVGDEWGFLTHRIEVVKSAPAIKDLEQAAISYHFRHFSGRGEGWYPAFEVDTGNSGAWIHAVWDEDGSHIVTYRIQYVGGINE